MAAPVSIDTVIVTDGRHFQSYATLGLQTDRAEIMRISRAIFEQVRETYNQPPAVPKRAGPNAPRPDRLLRRIVTFRGAT